MQSVNLLSLNALFAERDSFFIPRYQRPYSWSKDQVDALFSDHKETVEETGEDHIMGMIVLCRRPNVNRAIDIIDGQQRITTILLVLSWVRDKLFDLSHHPEEPFNAQSREMSFAYNLDDYMWNQDEEKLRFTTENEAHFEGQLLEISLSRFEMISPRALKAQYKNEYSRQYSDQNESDKNTPKLKIKVFSDSRVFNQTRAKAKSIVKNYKHIDDVFSTTLEQKGQVAEQVKWLMKIGKSYSEKLRFVPLVVPDYSQAFRLFETMNDRGLSVSALDLVKNEALKYGDQGERQATHDAWKEVFFDNLSNVSDPLKFLRYAHNSRHEFVPKSGLFSSYKRNIFSGYNNVLTELDELKVFSRHFNFFMENDWPSDAPFRKELVMLKTTKTLQWTTLGMVLMSLHDDSLGERKLILKDLFRFMHALIFTQLVNELRANTFETFFPELAISLWRNRMSSQLDERLIRVGGKLRAKLYEIGIPTKEDLLAKRIRNNTVGSNACYVFLLQNLAHGESLRTDWTLEHVYPQSAKEEDWGGFVVQPEEEVDIISCYSFGNFILLLKALNASGSNRSFTLKRDSYRLNRANDCLGVKEPELDYQSVDDWTPDLIQRRAVSFVDVVHDSIYGDDGFYRDYSVSGSLA